MFTSPILLCFALFLSLPLVYLLAPSILPPELGSAAAISLAEERDDLGLLRRAASPGASIPRAGKVSRLGLTRPRPKIAFLFLTNSDLTFAPLWERFFHGHNRLYNVYVHADPSIKFTNSSSRRFLKKASPRSSRSIWDTGYNSPGGVFDNRFIASKRTERASPTLIAAARRLLATALLDDPSNFYFALVSQHCIPLHSFNYMYKTLFGNSMAAFNAYLDPSRYQSFIEILSDEPNLYERYTARGESVMLPEVPYEEFRVGSQFYILTRQHSLLVVKDTKLWKKFKLPCLNKESCYPEEHYFPTLLSMSDSKGCSGYTLTNVNWTGSFDGHPHVYGADEVSPELIYLLRKSESSYSHLLARKFSPESLEPLMAIADDVIFRD